jgi:hypothetical protein
VTVHYGSPGGDGFLFAMDERGAAIFVSGLLAIPLSRHGLIIAELSAATI